MADKTGIVRNPLTIIAIFAGLAETSGTIVLPLLNFHIQATYVWFLMSFPALLLILFFAVLYFKHEVLYAPSDFANPEHFAKFVPARSRLYDTVRPLTTESPIAVSVTDDSEKSELVTEQIRKEGVKGENDIYPASEVRQFQDSRLMKILRREWVIDYISMKSEINFNRAVVFEKNSGVYVDSIGVKNHKQYMLMIMDIYDDDNIYINIFKFIMEIDKLHRSFSAEQERSNIVVPCISVVGEERQEKSDLFVRLRDYLNPENLGRTLYLFEFEANEASARKIDVIGHTSIPGFSSWSR